VGRTLRPVGGRRVLYTPEEIYEAVSERLEQTKSTGVAIDYLTLVPDGEPTLDQRLGRCIEALRPLRLRIAVITNASLLNCRLVQEDLERADLVSLKVDAADDTVWRRVNRPHRSLRLDAILEGMMSFRRRYAGQLITETMLVGGINDGEESIRRTADFLARLAPDRAYLSVPTRPPAERYAVAPDEAAFNRAYQIFNSRIDRVECLIGFEGEDFPPGRKPEQEFLDIVAVHPMREDQVRSFFTRAGLHESPIESLVARNLVVETEYKGHRYYLRRFTDPTD
jgi:wyosine [tRNA(Phe)-imidazoG37] synthetase (radical SAM superfamily)